MIYGDSSKAPDFLMLDYRSCVGIFIFIVHMRLWTLQLAVGLIIFFGVVSKFGMTIPVLKRYILRKMSSNVCHARPEFYQNVFLGSGEAK